MVQAAVDLIPDSADDAYREFVAISVGERHYVIDIHSVREIRGWTAVTPVPDSPPAIVGIINLRGEIVQIVDVRLCFGDPPITPDGSNVVVIVAVGGQLIGLLVDAVSDILSVPSDAAQEMPAFDGGAGQRTVPEVINHEDRLLGIIDLEKLVDAESLFNTAGLAADALVPVEDDSGILPLAQIALVQDSFANVVPIADQAAALFYEKLFELDPSVRSLFKGDMVEQGKKLMAALGVVVSNLKQPEKIIDTIQEMGRRHGEYGVKDAHYDTVGEALLWTLEQGLGPTFTPETRAAWAAAYGIVADTMKAVD